MGSMLRARTIGMKIGMEIIIMEMGSMKQPNINTMICMMILIIIGGKARPTTTFTNPFVAPVIAMN